MAQGDAILVYRGKAYSISSEQGAELNRPSTQNTVRWVTTENGELEIRYTRPVMVFGGDMTPSQRDILIRIAIADQEDFERKYGTPSACGRNH